VPVFFAADDGSCVGVAHAGWRGVAADVVGATVAALGNAFGSQPERLSACIGPAIEWRCYEVGEDVLARVRDATAEFGEPTERGRWRVDLRKAVRCQLERAGLTAERISVDDHCTACDEALFFSHRRQGRPHGTMAAVIGIRRG
ncbi:MAG: polyphenol oxidase family protein, partial [Armatimonadota bacterium]